MTTTSRAVCLNQIYKHDTEHLEPRDTLLKAAAALRAAAPSVPAGQTRVLEALQAWLGMQSQQNTSELYNEAAKFFGVDTAEFDPTEYDNVE